MKRDPLPSGRLHLISTTPRIADLEINPYGTVRIEHTADDGIVGSFLPGAGVKVPAGIWLLVGELQLWLAKLSNPSATEAIDEDRISVYREAERLARAIHSEIVQRDPGAALH